ncbi:unnamed protein product [Polarella glacialis]|uniref:Uncharacterized protein n=1 Tax=Polarella glacialis TaxID=89957 RepID=A0A813J4W9_POLGL|nr:unnamed protein product [Polarella glacialis]
MSTPNSRASDKKASDALSDRLCATPAAGSEADRFRDADDRLKALSDEVIQAIRADVDGGMPPDIATVLECWCLLHETKPASVAGCIKLAEDPAEFKLVGLSTLGYLEPNDLAAIQTRTEGLDPGSARNRPFAGAQAAAAMLEWLQAALALRRWADQTRQTAT